MIKNFFYILFVYFLLVFKSFSNEFIGVIGVAAGEIINQNNEKLLSGSKIFYGDTIVVKPKSNAQILFLDETVMTVGEDTELTIDDFIYDPKTNNGNFVTNIKSGVVKTISGKISEKNPENLEIKIPNGSLGVRGTEFLVSLNDKKESTVLLLGPGPENTLGMVPGNIKLTDGINTTDITSPGFQAMIQNVVSLASPANPEVLTQMSSSMSHSVLNSSNIVNSSKNLTTNLINSADLKNNIIITAKKFDLKSDESASEILSSLSKDSESKEILVAMNQLQENIVVTDNENYVRTLDKDTILYDSGWFDLSPVETGSNGLTYSLGDEEGVSQVFDTGATQQGRAKVYVNFNKKEISADVLSKITLKGASTVDYSFTTPTVTLTTIPVVASVPMAMGSSGGVFIDQLIDSGGGECPADSCTSLVRVANTLQNSALTVNSGTTEQLMDKYNHDTSNSDAAKEVFQYGKFTTVDSSGLTGLGTFVFEGAHDAAASPAGEAAYVQSIERLEGSTVVIGKALE